MPELPDGSYIDCTAGQLINAGSQCTLSCNDGFNPTPSIVTCESTGSMSDESPICEAGRCFFCFRK